MTMSSINNHRLHHEQSGQVMVFTIILLIVLALGALFLFDMHSSIRGKIKAQTASEAAALSMAKWQKESLNMIGELNIMKACEVLTIEVADPLVERDADMTDYEWLEEASKLIAEAQVRIAFVGPIIGVGAAQVAAISNGINPEPLIQKDFDTLINEIDDIVKYPITEYQGFEWKEPYKAMLMAVRDTGCAIRPNGITIGINDINPSYLAIESLYEAILYEYWCHPSLKSLLMQENLQPDWWHPEYNELAFPGESNIATLYTRFNNPFYYDPSKDNILERLKEMAQERGWTEQFADPDGSMLPPLQWCQYDEGRWANVPMTDDYNVNQWDQWKNDYWSPRMAADIRPEFAYNGAISKVQCERRVKLRSSYKARSKSKMLNETFIEETNKESSTYELERTVVGRAVAKPIGYIEDDNGDKQSPNITSVVLPVFNNVTIIPTTMFSPHMFDYEYSALEQFLIWLNQQDSLYGATDGLPPGGSQYLEALRRFDDPQWRKRGYNHEFNEADYSHDDFVTGYYLYDPSTNPKGAGWLQMACPRSSNSYLYYTLSGKSIKDVYIYNTHDDGKLYRDTYKADANTLRLSDSALASGNVPTRHAFTFQVNDNDTLTLTGISYNNDEGLCSHHGKSGGGSSPSRPPGPGML
jgi:Putative Flp pilus-assembly TadE/G-like